MAAEVTFDDTFVLQQLTHAAVAGRALLPPTSASRQLDARIKRCVNLLRKHHGLSRGILPTPPLITEQQCLVRGLSLLGHRLSLYRAFAMVESTIEIDWIAHTELAKAKRYRDRITHPMGVTAIGWWFLHRSEGALLRRLARHYEESTATYRNSHHIMCDGRTWEEIVEFAWLAAGLLHDCAFPLQHRLESGLRLRKGIPDTLGILPRIPVSFEDPGAMLAPLNSSWLAAQSLSLEHRIKDLCDARFRQAHALLGGLHHCLGLKRRLNSLQGLVVQLAARAIITHHDKTDDQIISDPLATLLFASDTLQSWQRPFLHREVPLPGNDTRTFSPLVECIKVTLKQERNGFVAVQHMNDAKRKILKKPPYSWRFEQFRKPYMRLEKLILKQGMLPSIKCARRRCIQPQAFL
jgi:hypothetical protein